MDYLDLIPSAKPGPVVNAGEFIFAATHLDHSHINDQCGGLIRAGARLKWVYDDDSSKAKAFADRHPGSRVARSLDEIFDDSEVRLVAAAAVPCIRDPLGCRVMEAGKDYFTDKAPFTTLGQLDQAKATAARTGRKYAVFYGERLNVESAMYAGDLVDHGVIGKVIQVIGLGPHRLNILSRPDWFFEREKYGGILCDIGSHQFEQFLTFTGATDATVTNASVANYANPDYPELEDFGEANLLGDNGATNYIRVDWFTPDGLSTWGDGRTTILGTKGYIELRKYVDIARARTRDHLYLVDEKGEHYMNMHGKIGIKYFGQLILDCLNRTENAMTQSHAFKAAELCLRAQAGARHINR